MKRRLERRQNMEPVNKKITGYKLEIKEGLTAFYTNGEEELFGVADLIVSTTDNIDTIVQKFDLGPKRIDYIIVGYSKPVNFKAFNNGRGWGWNIKITN